MRPVSVRMPPLTKLNATLEMPSSLPVKLYSVTSNWLFARIATIDSSANRSCALLASPVRIKSPFSMVAPVASGTSRPARVATTSPAAMSTRPTTCAAASSERRTSAAMQRVLTDLIASLDQCGRARVFVERDVGVVLRSGNLGANRERRRDRPRQRQLAGRVAIVAGREEHRVGLAVVALLIYGRCAEGPCGKRGEGHADARTVQVARQVLAFGEVVAFAPEVHGDVDLRPPRRVEKAAQTNRRRLEIAVAHAVRARILEIPCLQPDRDAVPVVDPRAPVREPAIGLAVRLAAEGLVSAARAQSPSVTPELACESERARVDVLVEIGGVLVTHCIRLARPERGQTRGDRHGRAGTGSAMERA